MLTDRRTTLWVEAGRLMTETGGETKPFANLSAAERCLISWDVADAETTRLRLRLRQQQ